MLKIFVISLAQATQRQAHIDAQLRRHNLTYSLFEAINGRKSAAQHFSTVDEYQHTVYTGRHLTGGEVGCYASHLSLWRKCVELQEAICILEDDSELHDIFPAALREAERHIAVRGFIRLQTEKRGKKKQVARNGEFVLYRYTKMPHSTLCYVISPRTAQCFLDHSQVMNCPVDVFIKRFWAHGQRLYGLKPYAVTESELAESSCIGGRVRDEKPVGLRIRRVFTKARWGIRRVLFNLSQYRSEWNDSQRELEHNRLNIE